MIDEQGCIYWLGSTFKQDLVSSLRTRLLAKIVLWRGEKVRVDL